MQAMICELCNSNDIVKQDGVYVCQHCGTKYSVEDARKLIGVVKIDKTEETEKLLILARRARDEDNSENAAKYYGEVLLHDPTNWEASFYQVYFQAMGCRIIDISNAASSIANNIIGTMKLIHDHVAEEDQDKAILEVHLRSTVIGEQFAEVAKNHYNQFSSADHARYEYTLRVIAAGNISAALIASILAEFPDKIDILTLARKSRLSFLSKYAGVYGLKACEDEIKSLTDEIREQDSSYTSPEVQLGGCYVATAVYGSYDCPQVWTLRRYRDYSLAKTWYGRAFIHAYYAVSPFIVKWFGKTEWFKRLWRGPLDRMVRCLNTEGYKNTPYEDKNW